MISVILPVYNVEKYIDACVTSLLQQTMQDFELILVNDGSTDKSGEKCLAWSKKDSRIRVIEQENQGLSEARNSGLKVASGEYIAFIDSDDTVEKEYLQTLYEHAVHNNAQIAVCNYRFVWEDTNKDSDVALQEADNQEVVYSLTGREAASQIVKENKRFMITAWGKLYHKSLSPLLFYPKGRTHEDEFVTYKVFYNADKVVVTMKPLYHYLQRGSGIMGTDYKLKRLDKVVALREAMLYFEERHDEEMRAYALKRYLLNIQIAWYRVHKYLPDEREVLRKLRNEWKSQKQAGKKALKTCCSPVDCITLGVFSVSPVLYGCVAGVYLKLFPQE